MALETRYQMIDNYIYLFHTKTFIVVPAFTDTINDTTSVNFTPSTPLSRSAPIYSYTNSGPRSLRVQFKLHRDMMKEINYGISNAPVTYQPPSKDDYVDYMVKAVQAAALPSYQSVSKMVNPPVVAVRLGSDIFIKGVVTGAVSVTYDYPIIEGDRYATLTIAFDVSEIDPYTAEEAIQMGSYRGVPTFLDRSTYMNSVDLTQSDFGTTETRGSLGDTPSVDFVTPPSSTGYDEDYERNKGTTETLGTYTGGNFSYGGTTEELGTYTGNTNINSEVVGRKFIGAGQLKFGGGKNTLTVR